VENSVTATDRETALRKVGEAYQGVARAQRRLRGRDAMQPGRLTAPQVNLLQPLAESGPMSSGQLADAAGLTPATTTHMLDQLAVAGVVERKRQENDKRVVITNLSETGAAMLADRIAEMTSAWAIELDGFDAEQLDAAADVILAICAFVDDL
jgi:DNA-binding MarR family transcriptional regulator